MLHRHLAAASRGSPQPVRLRLRYRDALVQSRLDFMQTADETVRVMSDAIATTCTFRIWIRMQFADGAV